MNPSDLAFYIAVCSFPLEPPVNGTLQSRKRLAQLSERRVHRFA